MEVRMIIIHIILKYSNIFISKTLEFYHCVVIEFVIHNIIYAETIFK
jgi:hypothetical protein